MNPNLFISKEEYNTIVSEQKDLNNPNYRIPNIEEFIEGFKYEFCYFNKLREHLPTDRFGENYGYSWIETVCKDTIELERELIKTMIINQLVRVKI